MPFLSSTVYFYEMSNLFIVQLFNNKQTRENKSKNNTNQGLQKNNC